MNRSLSARIRMLALAICLSVPPTGRCQQLSGVIDFTESNLTFNGYGRDSRVGKSVAPIGDFNGDGFDDVLIGGPFLDVNGVARAGSAFLLYGGPQDVDEQVTLTPSEAGVWFHGNKDRKFAGWGVSAAGDLNNDGLDDLLISGWPFGSSRPHEVYLVYGRHESNPLTGTFDTDDADATFRYQFGRYRHGADPTHLVGFGLNRVGDLDGDGVDDLAIGVHWADADSLGEGPGETHLFYSDPENPYSGLIDGATSDAVLTGERSRDISGWAIAPEFDFDGDGHNDLLITAPNVGNFSQGSSRAGKSYLFYGKGENQRLEGQIDLAAADLQIAGKSASDRSGERVSTGDFNGDGVDDLLIGADAADPAGLEGAGEAYLILGRQGSERYEGTLSLSDADLTMTGYNEDDHAAAGMASAGDVNGDGLDDILIGASGADPNGQLLAGETYLIYGRRDPSFYEGVLSLDQADVVFTGDLVSVSGIEVSSAGDFNGDGLDDLLIGAPYAYDINPGTAYIVFGRPVPEPSGVVFTISVTLLNVARRRRPT